LVVLLLLVGLVPTSSALARTATTAPSIYVNVNVTLTDSKVIVRPKFAPRGANARFIVKNVGKAPHSFTVGFLKRAAGLQVGFTRTFAPGKHSVFIVYLNYRGVVPYFSGASYTKATSAMKGTFVVGATCAACVQDN
jgi:hypothetical protein